MKRLINFILVISLLLTAVGMPQQSAQADACGVCLSQRVARRVGLSDSVNLLCLSESKRKPTILEMRSDQRNHGPLNALFDSVIQFSGSA